MLSYYYTVIVVVDDVTCQILEQMFFSEDPFDQLQCGSQLSVCCVTDESRFLNLTLIRLNITIRLKCVTIFNDLKHSLIH